MSEKTTILAVFSDIIFYIQTYLDLFYYLVKIIIEIL
jgi:hypothetical protein